MASKERTSHSRKSRGGTTQNVKLSKQLSYILRHGAVKEGLEISPSGYVRVATLLAHPKFQGYTKDDIRQVVADNDKQRFNICEENQELFVRANQGHSMEVPELELVQVESNEIPFAIHGTYNKCISAIKRDGLSKMGRQHIHMTTSEPGSDGVISGMRQSCDYIVRVNVAKAQQDGLKFYRSANNVILCCGDEGGYILPKYFDSVKPRRS